MEKGINELLELEKDKKTFEILKREQAITREEKTARNSLIAAGIFAAGLVASVVMQDLTGDQINQVQQHQLEALRSWDSLKQYFCDLGPAVTATTAGVAASLVNFIKHRKRGNRNIEELSILKNSKEENVELMNIYDKRRGNTNTR